MAQAARRPRFRSSVSACSPGSIGMALLAVHSGRRGRTGLGRESFARGHGGGVSRGCGGGEFAGWLHNLRRAAPWPAQLLPSIGAVRLSKAPEGRSWQWLSAAEGTSAFAVNSDAGSRDLPRLRGQEAVAFRFFCRGVEEETAGDTAGPRAGKVVPCPAARAGEEADCT